MPIREFIIKRVTVVVPVNIHKELKILAATTETTMNDLFNEAVKMYLQAKSKSGSQ